MSIHFVAADTGLADIFCRTEGKPFKVAIVAWRIQDNDGGTHVSPVYEGEAISSDCTRLGRVEADGSVTDRDGRTTYSSWAAFKFVMGLPIDERKAVFSGEGRPGPAHFLSVLLEAMRKAETEH